MLSQTHYIFEASSNASASHKLCMASGVVETERPKGSYKNLQLYTEDLAVVDIGPTYGTLSGSAGVHVAHSMLTLVSTYQ